MEAVIIDGWRGWQICCRKVKVSCRVSRALEEEREMCQVSPLRMFHVVEELLEVDRLPHCVPC